MNRTELKQALNLIQQNIIALLKELKGECEFREYYQKSLARLELAEIALKKALDT